MYYVNKSVSGGERPQELEVTPTAVYVRKGVEEVTEGEAEGETRTYYRYSESKYGKDELIELVTKKNADMNAEVEMMNGALIELMAVVMGSVR